MSNNYYQFERESENSQAKLFCFHYAGGSPFAYVTWSKYISENVDVYPMMLAGRNLRADEKFSDTLENAASEFAEMIAKSGGKRIFLTGHSMGGMIAYYTAYLLRIRYNMPVEKVFITASLPNLGQPLLEEFGSIHDMNDETFCNMLMEFGAIDERILKIQEFRIQFVPIIRADFAIIEKYKPDPLKKLDVPLAVYFGSEDRIVRKDNIILWRDYTSGEVIVKECSGGHFFINNCAEEICSDINRCI